MPLGSAPFDLRQLIGSLRTVGVPGTATAQRDLPVWPFVTVSRQAGSGGMYFGRRLAELLNQRDKPEHPWQCLDRELVERIAADHNLSTDLIESLERSAHNWISEFFGGLSHADSTPSSLSVWRRVVETMCALARAGHVILVGLGGAMITRDMPGGLHVRLEAPLAWRVRNLAAHEGITESQARARVMLLDRGREAFFRKFWPDLRVDSDLFHATLNPGMLTEDQMAECIVPLLRDPPAA